MINTLFFTSALAIWVLHTLFRLKNARRAFGDLPGRFWFLSETSLIAAAIPRIKFFAVGTNWALEEKHELYEKAGWDVMSSTSLYPFIRNILVLADAAVIKEVVLDRDRFSKFLEQYTPLTYYGDNIVASDGEKWKKYRKIAGPAFSDRNNKLVWQETLQILEELFEQVWGDSDSVVVGHASEMTMSTALCVLSAAGFGKKLSWLDDEAIPQGHKMTFRKAIEVATTEYVIKITIPRWALGLTNRFRYVRDGFDEMHLYIKEMIEDHQGADMSGRDDLFSNFLKANNEDLSDVKLDLQELIANTYMFLVAGIETTGHTLCFALALLALHTDEQEKLYEHICSVVPKGRNPTFEQMPLLTRSMAVFYETLRLFPPAAHVPKVTATDTTFTFTNRLGERKTVPVPEGTPIVLNFIALHHNPRYWEDPHAFKPDRFLGDWPRDAFWPFSGGARSCIGRRFSETESVAFLTLVVLKYKISVTDERQFAEETVEERKARVLSCTETITTNPTRVPLTFTRRNR